MVSENERAKILEMIEEGTITAEQGLTLLNALDGSSKSSEEMDSEDFEMALEEITVETGIEPPETPSPPPSPPRPAQVPQNTIPEVGYKTDHPSFESSEDQFEVITPRTSPPDSEEVNRWKRWWVIPFWVGAGITVIGGALMYWAYRGTGFGFWFACAWFPFLLGVAVLVLGWSSRTTPWLHVRVQQAPGESPQKIAISFPIPIRLTAWGLRVFGHRIPHMEGTNLDEVILALKDVAKDGTPLFIDVNEEEDGEHVQVFIG